MSSLSRGTSTLVRNVKSQVVTPTTPGLACTSVFRTRPQFTRQSSSSPIPKKPSPYRLIPLPTFLADFAPLHVTGWRLELLPNISLNKTPQDEGMAQLQDRRLVRRYDFEQGKDGWRRLMAFIQKLGEVVEKEDVHPILRLCQEADQ